MLRSHNKTILETLGRNPIHPFPARMAPGIALEALKGAAQPLRVLDPMVGSGTVIAVARANGHRAVGFDLDPLAVLLAAVWTRTIEPRSVLGKASEILDRARSIFSVLPARQAYPIDSDEETRSFIRYWFDDYSRRQLAALAAAIQQVHNAAMRDVLWCGFSRLIITKSSGASLAMDLSHSRPHREFDRAPIKPFNRFLAAVETVALNCPHFGAGPVGPVSVVKRGDARDLNIEANSIDLVLTSPPYLNAIDYMRCSKFSLVWMGYNVNAIRAIRGNSVGAEAAAGIPEAPWVKQLIRRLGLTPALSSRDYAILARYVCDIGHAIGEATRVLKSGGRAVYVVGDSTTKGTYIRNSLIVASVGQEQGLAIVSRQSRSLPANRRYLPPPKRGTPNGAMDARLRREVVIAFRKP